MKMQFMSVVWDVRRTGWYESADSVGQPAWNMLHNWLETAVLSQVEGSVTLEIDRHLRQVAFAPL